MTVKHQWREMQVTVIGLGIEGEDLARYFATHGASVRVLDRKDEKALAARLDALQGLDIEFRLGANDPGDVEGSDLVCLTQGAPLSNPAVVRARDLGIPIESMTTLFLERYLGPVVGITGSSGKTTTTSLVDAIFTAERRRHVFGGNVGRGLMALLDEGTPDTWAVIEVSHTQLVLTRSSPRVAALLNVTPNHLDAFTWEQYVGLKRKIFEFQSPQDHVVLSADDLVSRTLRPAAHGRLFLFSVEGDHGEDGAFLDDGSIYWRRDGVTLPAVETASIPLRGFHNVANVTAATAIAAACDIGADAVARAVRGFEAPEHRLELVGHVGGAAYYNDSIATAPERTLAALRSFEEPIVLLLGGKDKSLPLDELMSEVPRRCRGVICFGEAGPMLATAAALTGVTVDRVDTLAKAVEVASVRALPGDVVLLSPACTSFDAYDNFEQRGADFRRLVSLLAEGTAP